MMKLRIRELASKVIKIAKQALILVLEFPGWTRWGCRSAFRRKTTLNDTISFLQEFAFAKYTIGNILADVASRLPFSGFHMTLLVSKVRAAGSWTTQVTWKRT